jgi:hypothetical protein
MYLADFGGNLVDAGIVHTEALAGGQRFTGNFQEYAFINRSAHFGQRYLAGKVLIQFSRKNRQPITPSPQGETNVAQEVSPREAFTK